jgi:hypothetical protein
MATEVTISNMALAHLGDDANIADMDENTPQAQHCKRFLPIARDAMLEMHDWKFAKRRAALALRTETNGAWQYAYAEPADCIRVLGIMPSGYTEDDNQTEEWETETADDGSSIIYTNTQSATIRYTARITQTSRFSPLFVTALARLLASYIAGPIIKGEAGDKAGLNQYQAFLGEWSRAVGSNANQGSKRLERVPPSIAARDGSNVSVWADLPPIRGL